MARPHRAARTLLLAVLAAAALGACDDSPTGVAPYDPGEQSPPPPPARAVARVRITPGDLALEVGQPARLTATAHAADDAVLAGRAIAWRSEQPEIAAVGAGGDVTSLRPGEAWIVAESEGRVARARIVVAGTRVAALRVTSELVQLRVGDVLALSAEALDARGQRVADAPITFMREDPSVDPDAPIAVDAAGRVSARREGMDYVHVRSGDVSARVRVRVAPRSLVGRWALDVTALRGVNTQCTVAGVTLTLGTQVDGQIDGLAGGRAGGTVDASAQPAVGCTPLPGTEGPYVTPAAPTGAVEFTVTGDYVSARLGDRWQLHGWVRGTQITGSITYVDDARPATGGDATWGAAPTPVRTGSFVLTRQ